jgi:integrase
MKATSKSKRSKSKPAWPPILRRKYPTGQVAYMVACMVNGNRIRETFKTREEAETRAEQIRIAKRNEGTAAFSLSPDQRAEASKCFADLQPYDVSLTEVVNHYIDHVLACRNAPTISEIIQRMIADAETAKRRARTVQDLKFRLERFNRAFGDRQLASIELEELQSWLDSCAPSPRSRINYATKVSQLYNYAIRHQWVEKNLTDRLTWPSAEDKPVEVFPPREAAALLEHADDFGLLPFVAIGLFAGLRSAELLRLNWSAVKLSEQRIMVDAQGAKKRSRRVVEINDTLAAWLTKCGKTQGRIVETTEDGITGLMNRLAKAAGLPKWKHNGLRHSFGTYHLALHGDPVKTAFQMGNSPVMVHNHYKGLVSNGDVKTYWSLRPAGGATDKIVAMSATS